MTDPDRIAQQIMSQAAAAPLSDGARRHLSASIAAAVREAEERGRHANEATFCAGMAFREGEDDCPEWCRGKIIDCRGPEPRVLPMAPTATGEPSTLPVTADGYVVGLGAVVYEWDNDDTPPRLQEQECDYFTGELASNGESPVDVLKICYAIKANAEQAAERGGG